MVGTIVSKNFEAFTVDIGAESQAALSSQEFQNATKKDKPNFPEGTLVFCRVLRCEKFAKP